MQTLKSNIILNIFVVALGVVMIMDDAQHREQWGDWFHNPTYSVPFCLAVETVIVAVFIGRGLRERRHRKANRLFDEFIRLREQGDFEAAEAARQKWIRMLSSD
jgi:hypothetical protein